MKEYRVTLEIWVKADNPEEAVEVFREEADDRVKYYSVEDMAGNPP